jgi:signal transduction histidine kinase
MRVLSGLRSDLHSTPVKLALSLVAALALGLAILALWIGADVGRTLAARTEAAVAADIANLRAHAAGDGLGSLDAALAARRVGGMHYVLTRDGAVRAATFAPVGSPGSEGSVFRYASLASMPADGGGLAFGRTVDLGGGVQVVVARDIEDERGFARRLQWTLLVGILGLTLAGLVGGVALGRALDRRLARINATTTAIVLGDLTRRIDRDGSGDEFDRLSGNLNTMLGRLDGLMQALRDVSDNIAHDLKTPINRLRNTAEEALRAAPDKQRNALGAVIEQADAIIQTFNALLLIARLEHGDTADAPMVEVILSELVEDIAELYDPVAEDAKLMFALRLTDRVRFKVHRQLMVQAIANLVDNAIKYAGDPTRAYAETLSLTVVALPTTIEIIVSDRGPGIAPEDHATALKRFGRLDKSRTLPGTGLGLSLVAAIARLHGGRLRLGDNSPGLRAIIELPRGTSLPAG